MLVPDAVVFQLQFIFRRAADVERKMAGHRPGARLFSGKNVEMNHQKIRRGTQSGRRDKPAGPCAGSSSALSTFTLMTLAIGADQLDVVAGKIGEITGGGDGLGDGGFSNINLAARAASLRRAHNK